MNASKLRNELRLALTLALVAGAPRAQADDETATARNGAGALREELGKSGIEAFTYGQGAKALVLIGAIHGSHECNTALTLNGLRKDVETGTVKVPAGIRLTFIPLVNRTGCPDGPRENRNGVDLNRNWETDNWQQTVYPSGAKAGGQEPFSEQETRDLSAYLLRLAKDTGGAGMFVLSFHSAVPETGAVQPAYVLQGVQAVQDPEARAMARDFSQASGLQYLNFWTAYEITGELLNWCGDHQLACADVELTDRRTDPAAISNHLAKVRKGISFLLHRLK